MNLSRVSSSAVLVLGTVIAIGCGRTPLDAGDGLDGGAAQGGANAMADAGRVGGSGGNGASGGGGGFAGSGMGGKGGDGGRGGSGGRAGSGGSPVAGTVGTRLEIAPAGSIAPIGSSIKYTATLWRGVSPTDVTGMATWSVVDPDVAKIVSTGSGAGVLNTLAAGGTFVVATLMEQTMRTPLTVFAPDAFASLRLDPAEFKLNVNEQRAVRALATTAGGKEMDVTAGAAWTGDAKVVAVSQAPSPLGLVTGVAVGTGSVSATFGTLPRASATVTVVPPDETWMLGLEPPEASGRIGATVRFMLVGRRASDPQARNFTSQATWKPAKPDVATFDSPGVASCRSNGVTTFSASVDGIGAATGQISCSGAPAAVLRVTPSATGVPVGTRLQYFATIYYDDGTSTNVSSRATWKSSDTAVATVMRTGQNANVTAVASGMAVVTATADGLTGEATLTVTSP